MMSHWLLEEIAEMSRTYHRGSRQLQDQWDTRRLADRLSERLTRETIDDSDREFIERADMLFVATADELGRPTCYYKGGDPGFVRVLDERTVAFPNYDGNGMYLSAGNVLVNPNVGLLFVDFERQRRLRLDGVGEVAQDDPLLAEFPEAQFILRVTVRELFPNCPRYIHKYQLVERSQYVPRTGRETPVPEWKSRNVDVLPARDQARLRPAT
jgi:predicted pyridoxine 5'-phosphate oxidase superfamily flavin-nucleotide-binding protein